MGMAHRKPSPLPPSSDDNRKSRNNWGDRITLLVSTNTNFLSEAAPVRVLCLQACPFTQLSKQAAPSSAESNPLDQRISGPAEYSAGSGIH